MEEEKTITIQGKTINYGKLSNERLLQLYRQIEEKENLINQRILKYEEKMRNSAELKK